MLHSPSPQIAYAPGKIILSGEYAVVFGGLGLAIPSPLKTEVRFEPNQKSQGVTIENTSYPDSTYIQRIVELVEKQKESLKGSLHIKSTIPVGCGMGSSTALVIAITQCLFQHFPLPAGEGEGEGLKNIALSIEDALSPGHSGIDFEVIWQNRPLKFIKGQEPEPINIDLFFLNEAMLVDTGKPHETTTELISWIKKRTRHTEPVEVRCALKKSLKTIGHCTDRLLSGESPLTVFRDHHHAQVALGIVPPNVQKFIEDIEKSGGVAKVLGAGGRTGGGGIVLVLHNDPSPIIASYDFRCLHAQHRLCEVLG